MVSAQLVVVSVELRLGDLLSVGSGHVRFRAKVEGAEWSDLFI